MCLFEVGWFDMREHSRRDELYLMSDNLLFIVKVTVAKINTKKYNKNIYKRNENSALRVPSVTFCTHTLNNEIAQYSLSIISHLFFFFWLQFTEWWEINKVCICLPSYCSRRVSVLFIFI